MAVLGVGWSLLLLLSWSACLTKLGRAVSITTPDSQTTWIRDEALPVEWKSNSDDPASITVCLVNQQAKPLYSESLKEDVATALNSYTLDANSSIPAGSGYQIALVQMTNSSQLIMATSESFSIVSAKARQAQSSIGNSTAVHPAVIAVAVIVAVIILSSCVWLCWLRKRRRQKGLPSGLPIFGARRKPAPAPGAWSRATPTSPFSDAKPDIEETAATRGLIGAKSMHITKEYTSQSPTPPLRQQPSRQPSPQPSSQRPPQPSSQRPPQPSPQPSPPPPSKSPPQEPPPEPLPQPPSLPVQETAELPIFVTPRSSRQVFSPTHGVKNPAELDAHTTPNRSQSVRDIPVQRSKSNHARPGRSSKRLSLQHGSRRAKSTDCRERAHLSNAAHPSAATAEPSKDQLSDKKVPQMPSLSKALTWQNLFHSRRVAELEGSSASPTPSSDAVRGNDEDPQHPSPGRSHRISLHRFLQSRKLAELEADTDTLPEYSRPDRTRLGTRSPPPLPPKNMDVKVGLPAQQPTRAVTPVELEGCEPTSSSATTSNRALSPRSSSLPPSSLRKSLVADEWVDESEDDLRSEQSDVGNFTRYVDSSVMGWSPIDARDSMNLASTDGQMASSGHHTKYASGRASTRRSNRQDPGLAPSRSEVMRRSPDFLTFRKRVTDAERRARMIAKRSSHRKPRTSFLDMGD